MTNKPLYVVFNVGSGHGDAAESKARIEAACRDAGRKLILHVADKSKDVGELARLAVQQAVDSGGSVVAAGGDGTINTVAQAALGKACTMGVLPHGTFNYFSRTHGISSDPDEALQQLLTGQARPVQVGLVNDRVFLVNASLGLYPKLLEDREAYKKQYGRSRLVAFGAGLATLMGVHRPLNLRLDCDGQQHTLRTATLFIGNNALQLEQIGMPEAQVIESGRLGAISLKPVGRFEMSWLLVRGVVGRLADADHVENFAFSSMQVDRVRGHRRVKVATDGEVHWMPFPLRFRTAPEPLLLIKPDTDRAASSGTQSGTTSGTP